MPPLDDAGPAVVALRFLLRRMVILDWPVSRFGTPQYLDEGSWCARIPGEIAGIYLAPTGAALSPHEASRSARRIGAAPST